MDQVKPKTQNQKIQISPEKLAYYEAQGVDVTLLIRRLSMTPTERIEESLALLEDMSHIRPLKKS